MKIQRATLRLLALAAFSSVLGAAHTGAAQDAVAAERFRTLLRNAESQLGAMNDRSMYVMTDKPLYHPGETIWFRAWELGIRGLAPAGGDHGITFQLLDPRGGKLGEKRVLFSNGMATNDFDLGEGLNGGVYTLRALSDLGGTLEKKLVVSTYEPPRIKKTLEFSRKSYGPGDQVTAYVKLAKPTGEPLFGSRVNAVVTVDGVELARFFVPMDNKGGGGVYFQLPPKMGKGDGSITLLVDAGGVTESIQRRIPIVLDDADVAFFPEGGDLVDGLPSRVYVAAKNTLGKPMEVEGSVVDDKGKQVGHVKTFYSGMARFNLLPEHGRRYFLKLEKPRGVEKTFSLPEPRATGCTMMTADDYRSQSADLHIKVSCTDARKILLAAVLREKLLTHGTGDVTPAQPALMTLPLPSDARGAVRLTLFDTNQSPLAERLVYRGLGSEVHVAMVPDKTSYSPRDKVHMRIRTTGADGRPVKADVAVAVVDDTVLSFADDKSPNILSHLYLESEMPGQVISEPNFYFSSDPKAPEAMDLLLGTQGYRRFVWKWVPQAAAAAR